MNWLRKLTWAQISAFIIIPLTAYAVSWSMNGFKAPDYFREAIQKVGGIRITQVCRPHNASYGAARSLHKRCQAIDAGRETPSHKIEALKQYGLCGQFHKKGYFGATADHWHITACSSNESRQAARKEQRSRSQDIRQQNRTRATSSSRPSASVRTQRTKAANIRRQNVIKVTSPARTYNDDWRTRAFANQ